MLMREVKIKVVRNEAGAELGNGIQVDNTVFKECWLQYIPCNVEMCPILIDKPQPIKSQESWSRDEKYKA